MNIIKKMQPIDQLQRINSSRLLDASVIEKEMKIYSMRLEDLPLASALNEYLIEFNPYGKRGKHKFSSGNWLTSLDDQTLARLMETLSIGLSVDRHDERYRREINELYQITWFLLAAEKGRESRLRGNRKNRKKLTMDSRRFARHLGEVVEFVGQEMARRQGWILVEGTFRLLGDRKPQIIVTPKGARECPDLLEK